MKQNEPWLIVGQGLAGTCLGLEFLKRGIPFQIIDPGTGGSTQVAAGMINPLTGKNFEPSWRIEEFHSHAMEFFEELESQFSSKIWHSLPVMRLAASEKEWAKISSKLELPQTLPWLHQDQGADTPSGFINHVILSGGGWIDTKNFLAQTRQYFKQRGVLIISKDDGGKSPRKIRCEGAEGLLGNQLGQHRCAKGEILTVSADWSQEYIKIGNGGWLVPIGEGRFRVGSTYEWNQLDQLPTDAGLQRVTEIASKLGGAEFEMIDHVAGIRPILRRSQPLIGRNAEGEWIFNALGSKGTLYAPKMAVMLADWICGGAEPDEEFIFNPSNEFTH